ncbi:hypothetical protein Tco_1073666 [Tanacetum coccineum]
MAAKIMVRPLTYIPPKYKLEEMMSLKEKKEFYAMPLDIQLYYKQQYQPPLGEPDLTKPDDEDFWFSKQPYELVPGEKDQPLACSLETSLLYIRVPKDPKPFHRAKKHHGIIISYLGLMS